MDKRGVGVVLLALGILLLLLGGAMHSWWTMRSEGHSVEFGLHAVQECGEGVCHAESYDRLSGGEEKGWITSGNIAFYGAFVTCGFAAITLVLAFGPKRAPGSVSPARITMALALAMLVTAIVFIALKPREIDASMGFAFFAYVIGTVVIVAGAQLATMTGSVPPGPRGEGPRPLAAVPVGQAVRAVPACPTCRGPTEWVSEHGRFFCSRCSVYVSN